MHRHMIGLSLLLLVLVLPAATARPDDTLDEKLYGTWTITSAEIMGKTIPAPPDTDSTFTFSKDGKAVMKEKGKPDNVGTWKVSGTKAVKEIDLINSKEEGKKEITKALYQVEGDTLKLALKPGATQDVRPTALDSKEAMIIIFKRQKP